MISADSRAPIPLWSRGFRARATASWKVAQILTFLLASAKWARAKIEAGCCCTPARITEPPPFSIVVTVVPQP